MAKMIPVESVKPNSWNPNRMQDEVYKALVEDVKVHGVGAIDPIHVRPAGGIRTRGSGNDSFEVIDGEHRLRAVKEVGFVEIPCIVDDVSEDGAKAINYRKNKERGNMDPFREAELFKSRLDKGVTQEELATEFGVSQPLISQRVSLLKMSPKAKQIITRLIKSGKRVTSTHMEIMASLSKPIQNKVAEKLEDEPSTRELSREVEKMVITRFPEIAPEPVPTGEEYVCPICNMRYIPWHISEQEHKFDRVKGD